MFTLISKQKESDKSPSKRRGSEITLPPQINNPLESGLKVRIQRKASCVCGGSCPSCQTNGSNLSISQPNDDSEIEADQVAEKVMRKPITERGNSLLPKDKISRKYFECEEEEEKLQRKETNNESTTFALPMVKDVLSSGGKTLDLETRSFMESRFKDDFGNVKIHDNDLAAKSADSINALAYTSGNNIAFNSGQYRPDSESGKRLLAHELAHVVQQRNGIGRKTIQRFGDLSKVPPMACDVASTSPPSTSLTFLFKTSSTDLSADQRNDIALFVASWQASGGTDALRIDGYASMPGSDEKNWELSCGRALSVANELRNNGVPDDMFEIFAQGETSEFGGQLNNQRADVGLISAPPAEEKAVCPPTSVIQANTISEYLDLVACAEKLTGLSNRDMFSLLRQLYYGNVSWSRNRNSAWDAVIPCKVSFTKSPMAEYDSNLFESLQNSQVVEGKDIGHIFTGLEAMVCPQDVVISKQKFGFVITLPTDISNELFATWIGDIGSAVGRYVACWNMIGEADDATRQKVCDVSGGNFFNLTYYFQKLASSADLEGDIAAFVIRAEQNGIACKGSLTNGFQINAPVSQVLRRHFFDAQAAQGDKNRYQCFAESIGANLSGKTVTNKDELTDKYWQQVRSFAQLTYVNDVVIKGSRIPQGPTLEAINNNTLKALSLFWSWLENKLGP